MNPETGLRTRILRELRLKWPGFWFVVHGSAEQMSGLPDIIGVYRGRFIGFEVKMPGKKPTPIQQYRVKQITRAGGMAGVITSYEEAEALLESLSD